MSARIGILCVAASLAAVGQVQATCPISAQVSAARTSVVLGDPIDLTLVVRNTAAATIDVYSPNEKTGNVRLSIAEDANPTAFRPYLGPRWALKDSRRAPVRLAKNGSLRLNLQVLYNGVPRVANPDPTTEIRTPFAFSTAGRFVLRVRYHDRSNCADQPAEASVAVQVTAPVGEDLVVWDSIKDCAACAFLLQTREFDPNDRPAQDAVAQFRQLLAQYPRSRYAKSIRKVLNKVDGRSDDDDQGENEQ